MAGYADPISYRPEAGGSRAAVFARCSCDGRDDIPRFLRTDDPDLTSDACALGERRMPRRRCRLASHPERRSGRGEIQMFEDLKLLIGGELVDGDATMDVIDPAAGAP